MRRRAGWRCREERRGEEESRVEVVERRRERRGEE